MRLEQPMPSDLSTNQQQPSPAQQEAYTSSPESWQNKAATNSQDLSELLCSVQIGGDTDLSGNPIQRRPTEADHLNNVRRFSQTGDLPRRDMVAYVYEHCGALETFQSRAERLGAALGPGYSVVHLPARRSIRLDPHRLIVYRNGQEVASIGGPQPGFFDSTRP